MYLRIKKQAMDAFEKKKLKVFGIFWLSILVIPTLPLLWGALGITGRFSSWEEIVSLWLSIIPIIILFLIHNFLILPIAKRNRIVYAFALVFLVLLFGLYCFTLGNHPPGVPDVVSPMDYDPPSHQPARPGALKFGFGILAILANIGGNAIVDREKKEQERRLLEIDNLKLQLEALRYQINPHFFLNTLNNIQALILIDPDKASESLGVFSKMMQMILRYGNAPVIPLSDEICFLDYLVSLMRLRYTEDIAVETRLTAQTGDAVIQPLILTTFVENAFKHGISYKHPSYVRLQLEHSGGKIIFRCENTLHSELQAEGLGIGLENARKRIALLYGDQYKLHANPSGDHYMVELVLPDKIDIPQV